jgi:RNA polymerase sigma factor (sigma-70 family)
MTAALSDSLPPPPAPQDQLLSATVARERGRLSRFIRRRIADAAEAEDILQDTLYELVLAWRTVAFEEVGAWLMRVARNRIIDGYRRARTRGGGASAEAAAGAELADLLPDPEAAPEAAVMRELLLAEIAAALEALPPEQREVFVAHELEGVSFAQLEQRLGVNLNTLLSRKHYAVKFLRQRLQAVWDDWLMT